MASADRITIDGFSYDIKDVCAVDYAAQSLTDAQKATARGNIAAAGHAVTVTVTAVAAGWSHSTPHTQTVVVEGVTANDAIIVEVADDITAAQYDAAKAAGIICSAQGVGTITLTAFGTAPTLDIPVKVAILS